jgi:ABC-2 type transport system permease protein
MTGILRLIRAHFTVALIELVRYPLEFATMYIVLILLLGGIFLGMYALAPGGEVLGETRAAVFIGFMFWTFYLITVNSSSFEIARAAREGYIEREFLSPYGHTATVFTKIICGNAATLMHYFILSAICILIFQVPIQVDIVPVLIILGITYVFLLGIGFIFAGLSLAFKRIGSIINIVQIAIMGLSFAALGDFGGIGDSVLKWIPYTFAVRLLRGVLSEGEGLGYVLAPGNILPLAIGSIIFFVVGIIVFRMLDRLAMKRGLIGQF